MATPRKHPIGTNRTMARRKRLASEGGLEIDLFLDRDAAVALRLLQARWEAPSVNATVVRALFACARRKT